MILAGGLTPANVAAAVAAVRPAGVDTASDAESAPGRKSPELVQGFVSAARAALLSSRIHIGAARESLTSIAHRESAAT